MNRSLRNTIIGLTAGAMSLGAQDAYAQRAPTKDSLPKATQPAPFPFGAPVTYTQPKQCTVPNDAAMFLDVVAKNGTKMQNPISFTDASGMGVRTAGTTVPRNADKVVLSGTHGVKFLPDPASAQYGTVRADGSLEIPVDRLLAGKQNLYTINTAQSVGCTATPNARTVLRIPLAVAAKPAAPVYNARAADSTERVARMNADDSLGRRIGGVETRVADQYGIQLRTDSAQDARAMSIEARADTTNARLKGVEATVARYLTAPAGKAATAPVVPTPPTSDIINPATGESFGYIGGVFGAGFEKMTKEKGVGSVSGQDDMDLTGGKAVFGYTQSGRLLVRASAGSMNVDGETKGQVNPRTGNAVDAEFSGSTRDYKLVADVTNGKIGGGALVTIRSVKTTGNDLNNSTQGFVEDRSRTELGAFVTLGPQAYRGIIGVSTQENGFNATPSAKTPMRVFAGAQMNRLAIGKTKLPVDLELLAYQTKGDYDGNVFLPGTVAVPYKATGLEANVLARIPMGSRVSALLGGNAFIERVNFGQDGTRTNAAGYAGVAVNFGNK